MFSRCSRQRVSTTSRTMYRSSSRIGLVAPSFSFSAYSSAASSLNSSIERLAGRCRVLAQLLDREVRVGERAESPARAVEVPVVRELALGVQRDEPLDHARRSRTLISSDRSSPSSTCAALRVDHLALRVHDVVVLEDVLPRDEVLLLDLLLRVLDLLREEARLHRLVVGDLEALHDRCGSGRRRRAARGRPGRRGRSGTRRGRPDGPSGRGAGCRCAAPRGARCRGRRGRRAPSIPSASLMSTPRPAMFVAIVTAPV